MGASLVELLVVLVLVSVVGTMALNGVVTALRVSRQTEERVQAAAELQRAVERISRDVRSACPLEIIEADRVVGIVHPDGGAARRALYRHDTATRTLFSASTAATDPLNSATEIAVMANLEPAGALFAYLGDDGAAVTAAADVRTVRISLRRDLAQQDPVEIETLVALRNGGRACD
ncbi:MAG: hypothetical protein WD378_00880 [Egicoccus sp.]